MREIKEKLHMITGRHVWTREGDVVLVSPMDFQSDRRGDAIWRLTRSKLNSSGETDT